ncbi:PilZ domain-containing protein [Bradyrhizobium sp. ISRA435]|nr:PilZ domain-containing protein [Bradyrhizobium sp. ISRA435]
MQDRRHDARDKVLYGGVAKINEHGSTMDCVVRNISEHGACVEVDHAERLPEEIKLSVARKGPLVPRAADLAPGQQGRACLPHHDIGHPGQRSR